MSRSAEVTLSTEGDFGHFQSSEKHANDFLFVLYGHLQFRWNHSLLSYMPLKSVEHNPHQREKQMALWDICRATFTMQCGKMESFLNS